MSSDLYLTHETMSGLCDLLDPQNSQAKLAMDRPHGQTVGYSWAETPTTDAIQANPVPSQDRKAKSQVAQTPGGVYVPPSLEKKNRDLPVPSETRAGRELATQTAARPKPKGNAIWDDTEVDTFGAAPGEALMKDTRVTPEYDVLFKQSVSAEDVYLGVDFSRDGSASTAEEILVRFKLPLLESSKDVELDVERYFIHLRTKDYTAKVSLPAKVVEKRGAAKWDSKKKELNIVLTVDQDGKDVKLM